MALALVSRPLPFPVARRVVTVTVRHFALDITEAILGRQKKKTSGLTRKFYDRVRVFGAGGRGGNGAESFCREPFKPFGGPDGGNGGKGGDLVFEAAEHVSDLRMDRFHFKAENATHGAGRGMQGRNGADLVVKVPVGTVIKHIVTPDSEVVEEWDTGLEDPIDEPFGKPFDEDAFMKEQEAKLEPKPEPTLVTLCDLDAPGQRFVAARGGKAGRGNMSFVTKHDRAPRKSTKGGPGEELRIELELKSIADVGLVGFPNAGKSTLLGAVSKAKPKVADYPFTTIRPYIGLVDYGFLSQYAIADLPGLLKGAHRNVGLGHSFLRHIERTKVKDKDRGEQHVGQGQGESKMRLGEDKGEHR